MPLRASHRKVKKIIKTLHPKSIRRFYNTKHIVADIAEKYGLVYFGYVNQKDDEHRLIRGHTTSTTHVDNHYCVGSIKGYDMSLVLRTDSVVQPSGKHVDSSWLLAQIDLRSLRDAPRIFIAHHSGVSTFKAKYTQLLPMAIPLPPGVAPRFSQQFVVYANPAHFELVTQLITPQTVEVISSHFGNATIEIDGDILYVSIPTSHITRPVVETAITNTLWLAEAIDGQHTALARAQQRHKQ